MNKLTKRLAAIGAAMTMAVSMMSMGASAATESSTWTLRRVKTQGAPSSESISSAITVFAPNYGKTMTKISDKCTDYSSANTTNGDQAWVQYKIYKENNDGTTSTYLKTQKHTGETTNSYSFSPVVKYGNVIRVRYSLINYYDLSCYMSGRATVTIS